MKIGQGLQFNVYDIGNNQVEKIRTSPDQIRKKLLKWYWIYYLFMPSLLKRDIKKAIEEREKVIYLLKIKHLPKHLFANLNLSNNKLIQDKSLILKNKLHTTSEATDTIEKYISFIFDSWKHGFCEKTFNLTVNYGINQQGNVVLLDFGEITFDKEEVKKFILSRRWEKSWSYKRDLPRKVKDYYAVAMQQRLTLNQLDILWNKAYR